MNMFFLYTYSKSLEEAYFGGRSADYLFFITIVMALGNVRHLRNFSLLIVSGGRNHAGVYNDVFRPFGRHHLPVVPGECRANCQLHVWRPLQGTLAISVSILTLIVFRPCICRLQ